MKKAGRAVFHAVYFVGLLLIVLLPVDRYKWMSEMSPDISVGAIEDASGNSVLFVFLLLIGVVAIQFILLIRAQRKLDRVISIVLMLFALLVWGVRFW